MNIICPVARGCDIWCGGLTSKIEGSHMYRQAAEERSFDIQIYKDLVFFLLLVGFLLRRGLISSLNSVA